MYEVQNAVILSKCIVFRNRKLVHCYTVCNDDDGDG
jgi:hypothetical protein